MVMCCEQNAGYHHNIMTNNKSFEMVGRFKYLGKPLTHQISNREEIVNIYIEEVASPRNTCCHSLQNLLSTNFLSKNMNIKLYRNIILPMLYGCETWSLTMRSEHRLRMFKNRVLRKVLEPKRDEVRGEWRRLHNGEAS